jgi:hypothetical protein
MWILGPLLLCVHIHLDHLVVRFPRATVHPHVHTRHEEMLQTANNGSVFLSEACQT